MRQAAALGLCLMLAGCGLKGDLYLPPEPEPVPASTSTAPAENQTEEEDASEAAAP